MTPIGGGIFDLSASGHEAGLVFGVTSNREIWAYRDATSIGALQAVGRPWLIVSAPTQVYSVAGDSLWIAQVGEWYRIRVEQDGWALAVRETDGPEWSIWIELNSRVQHVRA
jgi:hypothetical protein